MSDSKPDSASTSASEKRGREPWQCEECGCQSRAFMDERQPDGSFARGRSFRCVNCKRETIVRSPEPSPEVSKRIAEAREMQLTGQYINGGVFHTLADEVERLAAALAAAEARARTAEGALAGARAAHEIVRQELLAEEATNARLEQALRERQPARPQSEEDGMFTVEESWGMTEPEKVVAIIKELECWRLGNWDGCCCSQFSIRNVDVEISCGKGREQAVWISSRSFDYDDRRFLGPIMAEVVRQVTAQSGRGGNFARYIAGERQSEDGSEAEER